jgi:hypothetical protein
MINYSGIRKDMDVYDMGGDKIGTIGEVHTPAGVTGTTYGTGGTTSSGVLKVDTGFLGLGKDLWIPFSSVREVRGDEVHLSVDKDDLDRMGWDERPTWVS